MSYITGIGRINNIRVYQIRILRRSLEKYLARPVYGKKFSNKYSNSGSITYNIILYSRAFDILFFETADIMIYTYVPAPQSQNRVKGVGPHTQGQRPNLRVCTQ